MRRMVVVGAIGLTAAASTAQAEIVDLSEAVFAKTKPVELMLDTDSGVFYVDGKCAYLSHQDGLIAAISAGALPVDNFVGAGGRFGVNRSGEAAVVSACCQIKGGVDIVRTAKERWDGFPEARDPDGCVGAYDTGFNRGVAAGAAAGAASSKILTPGPAAGVAAIAGIAAGLNEGAASVASHRDVGGQCENMTRARENEAMKSCPAPSYSAPAEPAGPGSADWADSHRYDSPGFTGDSSNQFGTMSFSGFSGSDSGFGTSDYGFSFSLSDGFSFSGSGPSYTGPYK